MVRALESQSKPPRALVREVAATHAADVDANARFPREALEAMRRERLLSAAVPRDLGGASASAQELAADCAAVAQGCASAGMVLAMHHIQVACLARHALETPFFREYLREIAERQLLVASVTSEVGVWGDTRQSICAVRREGDRFALDKDATTISYAEAADDLLVTARRDPAAPAGDQVLVLLRRGDYTLECTTSWDTLGMRGTCSPGYRLSAAAPCERIVPVPFADVSAETMVPYAHVLWSAVWLGIASDAMARAGAFVRAEARRTPGVVPPRASRLAEASVMLQTFRNNVAAVATELDEAGPSELATVGWALKMNALKVSASEAVPRIVHEALQIVGIAGYKNDSKLSLGRNYRDALSAALMVSNDRINAKSAPLLLVYKDE